MLGWKARTRWDMLARIMLANDLRHAGIDLLPYPELITIPQDRPLSRLVSAFSQDRAL